MKKIQKLLFILLICLLTLVNSKVYATSDNCNSYSEKKTCEANYCSWIQTAHDAYCLKEGTFVNNNNNDSGNNSSDSSDNGNSNNDSIDDIIGGDLSCGGVEYFTFPTILPNITSTVYTLLKIAIPVLLIIKGMMDMFKATTAGKEDEMKKAQKKFTQRLIAGALALLAFIIIETVVNFIADKTNNSNAMDCVNCFIKGSSSCKNVTTNKSNKNSSK